jgi:hypothetical protein
MALGQGTNLPAWSLPIAPEPEQLIDALAGAGARRRSLEAADTIDARQSR